MILNSCCLVLKCAGLSDAPLYFVCGTYRELWGKGAHPWRKPSYRDQDVGDLCSLVVPNWLSGVSVKSVGTWNLLYWLSKWKLGFQNQVRNCLGQFTPHPYLQPKASPCPPVTIAAVSSPLPHFPDLLQLGLSSWCMCLLNRPPIPPGNYTFSLGMWESRRNSDLQNTQILAH